MATDSVCDFQRTSREDEGTATRVIPCEYPPV